MAPENFNPQETITLKPSRLKWLGVFLICAVFSVIGVFMVRDGELMGWLPLAFFGVGVVISLMPLIGYRCWLRLGPDGFEQSMMGRRMKYRWDEVSDFHVWGMKQGFFTTNQLVSFEPLFEERHDAEAGSIVGSALPPLRPGRHLRHEGSGTGRLDEPLS